MKTFHCSWKHSNVVGNIPTSWTYFIEKLWILNDQTFPSWSTDDSNDSDLSSESICVLHDQWPTAGGLGGLHLLWVNGCHSCSGVVFGGFVFGWI